MPENLNSPYFIYVLITIMSRTSENVAQNGEWHKGTTATKTEILIQQGLNRAQTGFVYIKRQVKYDYFDENKQKAQISHEDAAYLLHTERKRETDG